MQLKKDSWHYKLWAGTFSSYDVKPYNTDLCRYCHRVFWALMGRLWIVACLSAIAWLVGWGVIYKGFIQNTLLTFEIGGTVAAVISVICLYVWWLNRDRYYSEPRTLVGKFAKASKDKVCPLVDFEEDDS